MLYHNNADLQKMLVRAYGRVMENIKMINMVIAFLLELCLLATFAYWGFNLKMALAPRLLIGICAPAIVVVLWSHFLAPTSDARLDIPLLVITKLLLFFLGALALFASGKQSWAIVLMAVFTISESLALFWSQETHK